MTTDQHGDRFGDRSGQVPGVGGDSCPCVLTRTGPTLAAIHSANENADPARLDAAIATVIAMTEDEFYAACEAIRLTIHDDHSRQPNNIRSITQ